MGVQQRPVHDRRCAQQRLASVKRRPLHAKLCSMSIEYGALGSSAGRRARDASLMLNAAHEARTLDGGGDGCLSRSSSSRVIDSARERRSAPRALLGERPMAVSTCEGSVEPVEQADPVAAATPARSRSTTSSSPSMLSQENDAMEGRRPGVRRPAAIPGRLTSGLASEAPTAVATGFVSGAAALATASWFVSEAATTATAGFASDPVRASLDADSAQA